MIASPCRTCPRRDQPKENCMYDCELLQKVQKIDRVSNEVIVVSGIDCSEVDRFSFNVGVNAV